MKDPTIELEQAIYPFAHAEMLRQNGMEQWKYYQIVYVSETGDKVVRGEIYLPPETDPAMAREMLRVIIKPSMARWLAEEKEQLLTLEKAQASLEAALKAPRADPGTLYAHLHSANRAIHAVVAEWKRHLEGPPA